eukprot:5258197-Prymnesium_polylepis.3
MLAARVGEPLFNVRKHMLKVAAVGHLQPPEILSLHDEQILFCFESGGPVRAVAIERGLHLAMMAEFNQLVACIVAGECTDPLLAMQNRDAIAAMPPVFGCRVETLGQLGFGSWVTIAFGGDMTYVLFAFIINAICMAVTSGLRHPKMKQMIKLDDAEFCVFPFLVGLLVPLFDRDAFERDTCHDTAIILGIMLYHLPGMVIVEASMEVMRGMTANGGARLVHSMIKEVFVALGLTLGWQAAGGREGEVALVAPTNTCDPFVDWWLQCANHPMPNLQ